VHDLAAVQTLVDHLTARLSAADLERVEEVRIAADGTLSVAALRLAYEVVTQDTALAGSTLVIDLRSRWHLCPTCERTSPVAHEDLVGHLTICPLCGAMSAVETGDGIELVALTSRDAP
jgi:Zn finger protein HypA/HybF involved in hydrogenase expression